MTPAQTALRFIHAINAHDVKAIIALMHDDHRFLDAWGGREDKFDMETGWPGYFAWFPDYRIEVGQVLAEGNVVGVFGFASGTYHGGGAKGGHYHLPASWRVVVQNGKVKVWQVYCDQKVIIDTMGEDGKRFDA